MLARPRWIALGVKLGTVIQRHGVVGIDVAEDMSTVSAMVTPLEQVEGLVACGRVANDGVGIGLPMVSRGETFDRPEGPFRPGRRLRRSVRIRLRCTCAGGSSAPRSSSIPTVQTVGAAVDTARGGERRRAVGPFGRSQHGGDVQGQFRRSELPGGQRKIGQDGGMMRG